MDALASTVDARSRGRRRPAIPPEHELMLLLSGTAELRAAREKRIRALVERSDLELLSRILAGQGLLGLVGGRLEQIAPSSLSGVFRDRLAEALAYGRRRAALFEQATLQLASGLEE